MKLPCLTLNSGSSSIKFAVFDLACQPLLATPAWSGKVDGITSASPQWSESVPGNPDCAQTVTLRSGHAYADAVARIRARALAVLGRHPAGVMHRIVHGGGKYHRPIRLTPAVLADLRSYIPLAPLHQPHALEAIDRLWAEWPDVTQWACFDTAFHGTLPDHAQRLPLPHALWDRGIRRYGFHGLSYQYLAQALQARYGERAQGRVIAAHLGSGASLCAMHQGRSQYTTMGFSALDGLMMGSRCGALDPGVVLHLMQTDGLSVTDVAHLLYHHAGLLGVSGLSPDPRVLLAHEAEHEGARAALTLYVHQVAREIAALITELGGLDLLVFSAGVGEHNAEIRRRITERLGWAGIYLDDDANQRHAHWIARADSPVGVAVEPTNEEWMMARHAHDLVHDTPLASDAAAGSPST